MSDLLAKLQSMDARLKGVTEEEVLAAMKSSNGTETTSSTGGADYTSVDWSTWKPLSPPSVAEVALTWVHATADLVEAVLRFLVALWREAWR